MNNQQFNKILEKRILQIKDTLMNKAKEYATEDRLYNFKKAAAIDNETTAQALWGMAKKHLVSVIDLKDGRIKATDSTINEKIGDMINYLILLEAVLREEEVFELIENSI